MLLKIDCKHSAIVLEAKDAGPLVASLENAKYVSSNWENNRLTPEDEPIGLSFIPNNRLEPMPDPMKKLIEQSAHADTRWIECYNKFTAEQQKVKDLEARLAKFEKLAQNS